MTDRNFYADIARFNSIYKLEANERPALLPPERLDHFRDILSEEVEEVVDIRAKYAAALERGGGSLAESDRLALLTDMGDWLGDIMVYCASEARRWGLPLKDILGIIMESNFSKLDPSGEPIYDHRGKVMKGPNYWKPEPKIAELLASLTADS